MRKSERLSIYFGRFKPTAGGIEYVLNNVHSLHRAVIISKVVEQVEGKNPQSLSTPTLYSCNIYDVPVVLTL